MDGQGERGGGGGPARLILTKQTGDGWDTLETPRPARIQSPPLQQGPPPKPSLVDFESAATEVARMSHEIRGTYLKWVDWI